MPRFRGRRLGYIGYGSKRRRVLKRRTSRRPLSRLRRRLRARRGGRGRARPLWIAKPFGKQCRFKAKWTWGGPLTTPGVTGFNVYFLGWDVLTDPGLYSSYSTSDAIFVNCGQSNQANQNMFNLANCMEFFSQYIQYGMKVKLRITCLNDDSQNHMWFTGLLEDSGVPTTNWQQRCRELPGFKIYLPKSQGTFKPAGTLTNVERAPITIKRYFSLDQMALKWRKDPTSFAAAISNAGALANPSSSAWGHHVLMGFCTQDGSAYGINTTYFRMYAEVTHYYKCWSPRWWASS